MNAVRFPLFPQTRVLQSASLPMQTQPSQFDLDINNILNLMMPMMVIVMMIGAIDSVLAS